MTIGVVDGNNVAIASWAVSRDLRNSKGLPTGIYFQFLRTLRTLIKKESLTQMYVAWDSPFSWRKDYYPEYKANRKDKNKSDDFKEYFNQLDYLKKMCEFVNLKQIQKERYEADDLAAFFSKAAVEGQDTLLISNDKDWHQLVHPKCTQYIPRSQKKLTAEMFTAVTGCDDVEMFQSMKAIMGDDGDNVPGVVGVGEITALKYLKGDLSSGAKYEAISKWMEDPQGYQRSRTLTDLGQKTPDISLTEIQRGFLDEKQFEIFCKEMEYGSILEDVGAWLAPFASLK